MARIYVFLFGEAAAAAVFLFYCKYFAIVDPRSQRSELRRHFLCRRIHRLYTISCIFHCRSLLKETENRKKENTHTATIYVIVMYTSMCEHWMQLNANRLPCRIQKKISFEYMVANNTGLWAFKILIIFFLQSLLSGKKTDGVIHMCVRLPKCMCVWVRAWMSVSPSVPVWVCFCTFAF